MAFDWTLYAALATAVLLALGFLGSFLPVLPGPPLGFAALAVWSLASPGSIRPPALVLFGTLTLLVTVLDYLAPAWCAKMGGGSRGAVWGTAIGTVVGLFFLPLGIVVGPFLGAFLGERLRRDGAPMAESLRIAGFSLLAFLATTGAKLLLCVAIAAYLVPRLLR